MTSRPLSGHWPHQAWFILFFRFALATLQNVTVDDAVLVGSTAPNYLPSSKNWNQAPCAECAAQPNPSMAYNGTWHDATFEPTSSIDQEFEFTFVGSAVYIFFILANTIPDSTTYTHLAFTLDGVQVSTFANHPTTSTNYEYNQVVYANDSIPFGQHTMLVTPVNDLVSNILMLFDYYIYTTNVSDVTTTTTTTGSVPTTALPSPATSPNIGPIVGGVVGGCVIAIVTTSLLRYRRYKGRTAGPSPQAEGAIEAPFVQTTQPSPETARPGMGRKGHVPASLLATVSPSSPALASQFSSGDVNGTAELREQVELLRDEVGRMRRIQDRWDASIVAVLPPEYSQD